MRDRVIVRLDLVRRRLGKPFNYDIKIKLAQLCTDKWPTLIPGYAFLLTFYLLHIVYNISYKEEDKIERAM